MALLQNLAHRAEVVKVLSVILLITSLNECKSQHVFGRRLTSSPNDPLAVFPTRQRAMPIELELDSVYGFAGVSRSYLDVVES